jgi:tetratricopeptide (TPR) repeat protein
VNRLRAALASALLAGACAAGAVESDPLPVPAGGAAATAVRLYNEGVALLVQKNFAQAQRLFEQALTHNEQLAEAHNNLAFALRMQGRHNLGPALAHYNRALALKPQLAQAYLYRGMLFVQQGDTASARQDLERLQKLDARLAGELADAIAGRSVPDGRGGIAAQYE